MPLGEGQSGDWISDRQRLERHKVEDIGWYETVYHRRVADHDCYFAGGSKGDRSVGT